MDFSFYQVAIPAVTLLGISKGGFTGVGMAAMPIMALAVSPIEAASIMLPILVVQDAVGVFAYRRSWDAGNLIALLPGAILGVLVGYLTASLVSEAAIKLVLGVVSIAFGGQRLIVDRGGRAPRVTHGRIVGFVCGAASGFTSMIAHAGGPPFQIFVMPQRLPHELFVGTTVVFFAIVNAIKIPPYLMLGHMTAGNLLISATLVPLAIASTWLGIWFVRRASTQGFYTLIYVLMLVVGVKLVWDGVRFL